MRIEQLLEPTPSSTSGVERPRPRAPISGRTATPRRQPIYRPDLVVRTSPTGPVPASSPDNERFSWELDEGELAPLRHRKRKSPVDEESFSASNNSARLPRFSVNIFHSEPVNAFPIPNEGVVPRMVKYCEQEFSSRVFSIPDRGCRLASLGATAWASSCL